MFSFHQSGNQNTEQERRREIQRLHKNTGHAYSQDVLSLMLGRDGSRVGAWGRGGVHTGEDKNSRNNKYKTGIKRQENTEGFFSSTLSFQFPCVVAVNAAGASTAPPVNRKSLFKPCSRAEHMCVRDPGGVRVWGGENCARAPSCGGRQNCGHKKTDEQISRTVELIERKKQRTDRGTACLKKKRTKSRKTKHPGVGKLSGKRKKKNRGRTH